MIFKNKSKKRAFGLIEVLVTIAISSILILGAISVAARSLKTVRGFELRDTTSGVLLRSQELARSPVDIQLRNIVSEAKSGAEPSQGDSLSFVLEIAPSQDIGFELVENQFPATQSGKIENCNSGSSYELEVSENYFICNQILVDVEEVVTTPDSTEYMFRITSVIAYEFDNQIITDELVNFRREFVTN